MTSRLDVFDNAWFDRGAGVFRQTLWYLVSAAVFQTQWVPFSSLKTRILRAFGARIGEGLVIKPSVRIKYPWRLQVGDHVWIGEGVWIDNLVDVTLGSHVCLSQGAILLTGSHDYRSRTFDLLVEPIDVGDGAWIGAKAIVCPGVKAGSGAVLAAGSTATTGLEQDGVYQGNPATWKRHRWGSQ